MCFPPRIPFIESRRGVGSDVQSGLAAPPPIIVFMALGKEEFLSGIGGSLDFRSS